MPDKHTQQDPSLLSSSSPVIPRAKPHADFLQTQEPYGIQQWLTQFHVAFALMTVIPLLICCYLITVKFFSISILAGIHGVYFLLAVILALLGLLAGRRLIMRLVNELVDLNRKFAKLTTIQTDFVNHVAHEFRAPLTIIKGTLENLRDALHGPLAKDQVEPVEVGYREASRMARLVGDLLDVAHIESGKLSLRQQRIVLQDLLRTVAGSCQVLLTKRGLSVSLDFPNEEAVVVGDPDRLTQTFVNLITNAVKYTDQGGVRVRLSKDLSGCLIEVADTGSGIPHEDLQRIFEKFERSGDHHQEGSGLGLPIAKAIVELHQGRIWAESQVGKGSSFFVSLPKIANPGTG